MWGLYIEPETNKEKKHLNSRDIPCNEAVLSQWIVEWMGYQQTLAQPGVVAVNKDKAPDYWKKCSILYSEMAYFGGKTMGNWKRL